MVSEVQLGAREASLLIKPIDCQVHRWKVVVGALLAPMSLVQPAERLSVLVAQEDRAQLFDCVQDCTVLTYPYSQDGEYRANTL